MILRKGLLLFLLLTLATYLPAQNTLFQFSRIDIARGLSNNGVNCVFKDSKGFLWFGTQSGLNRFDGYTFKVFRNDLNDSTSISDNSVIKILEGPDDKLWVYFRVGFNIYDPVTERFDHRPQLFLQSIKIPDSSIATVKKDASGNFWFSDTKTGLYKYNPSSKQTIHFYHDDKDDKTLHSDNVTSIAESASGGWWIIYGDGVIDKMDEKTNKITYRNINIQKLYPNTLTDYQLFSDSQNDLWIYIASNNHEGIFYYNTASGQIQHIHKGNNKNDLNNDLVNGIVQDNNGLIWIATDHGGVNLLNKNNFSIQYLLNREDDDKSISQNSLTSIYKDEAGIVWIGTFKKGISYYHNDIIKFPLYRKQLLNPSSLSYNDVNKFAEDAKGNLWIGANGGGLIYLNRKTGEFKQYVHNAADPNSLCNNVIVSLCIDHEQKLWIGTYYGGLDCFDGKNFKHYKHNDTDSTTIGDDRVWEITEDAEKRLWIGTFAAGMDLFDRQKQTFIHYKGGAPNSVISNYITVIVDGKDSNLWIGTSYGFDVMNKTTGKFTHFGHDDSKPTATLSNNNILSLIQDSRGFIWVGTRDGLNVFDPLTQKCKIFRVQDGLPDNAVTTILEDKDHNLWLGTPNGLSHAIAAQNKNTREFFLTFKNYDENDGLQGKEFNEKAAFKLSSGELIFGGANGFNIFNPANIRNDDKQPSVILTGLQLFNNNVAIGEKINGHIILPQSITAAKEITLRYNENVFSIEFASLGFPVKNKMKYSYMLEGFDKKWLTADDKTRKATFTNLDPGDYTFKVRTSKEDGSWSDQATSIAIKILPPFWKTTLAYIIYVLLAISALILGRRAILQRARMRFAIEHERKEAQRLHELDMMKIRFFTNVSHEFRTPLSLILSPLDKIIRQSSEADQKKQFQLIHRNARRLLNLVNQLLDFRKMEVQELRLHEAPGDIAKFIKDISSSFTDLAEKKNIQFDYASSVNSFYTKFDHDKIERILFNLLSNAFKFTPENGSVMMDVSAEQINDEEILLCIKIKDTGIGIPPEKKEKIFERFFQNELPGTIVNLGSGIGLAITKEFVKLHKGTINVESEVNVGSTFAFSLPLKQMMREDFTSSKIDEEPYSETVDESVGKDLPNEALQKNSAGKNKKPIVLLVEDNEDFRFYLKDNLREYFNIVEASNGKEGWQKALSVHPDLVVSDISMPQMNGIELCRKIKSDSRTSFVPVILLTAITGEDQQLKGLETGANDYMGKPFNFEILLSKIRNLLAEKEKTKKAYQKQIQANPSNIEMDSPDEKFIKQVLEVIEKNMSNDEFSVEEMSRSLFISRVALYKKLLAITGKTPVEYIRSMRMQRAAQLLEKSDLTIAEIAYEVGFNNPKYFSRYFKKEFGMLPSEYQIEKKKKQFENSK